jgi:hypothetical protein
MRFIGVLALIAGLGFAISAVQFVRMGVSDGFILTREVQTSLIIPRSNGKPSCSAHSTSSLSSSPLLFPRHSPSVPPLPSSASAKREFSASRRIESTSGARSTSYVSTRRVRSPRTASMYWVCGASIDTRVASRSCTPRSRTCLPRGVSRVGHRYSTRLPPAMRSGSLMERFWAIPWMSKCLNTPAGRSTKGSRDPSQRRVQLAAGSDPRRWCRQWCVLLARRSGGWKTPSSRAPR